MPADKLQTISPDDAQALDNSSAFDVIQSFYDGMSTADRATSPIQTTVMMLLGGIAALYIRFLYRRFSATASNADSISRVFPLLLIITTGLIAVVKSNISLSLGLVGALSIVRFRAAIKDPEELVYLFLCIGVGLSLGAGAPMLAVGILAAVTVFAIGMHVFSAKRSQDRMLLTIRGAAEAFRANDGTVLPVLNEIVPGWSLHRMDVESGYGQMRVALRAMSSTETSVAISTLSEKLPECEFSWVNLNSAV